MLVLSPASHSLPKYVIHAKHGVVTSPRLCVLSEKGSVLRLGQTVSDMPLYNMKPVYTRLSLRVHFFYRDPHLYILLQAFPSKIAFGESVDPETLLTGGKSRATGLLSKSHLHTGFEDQNFIKHRMISRIEVNLD